MSYLLFLWNPASIAQQSPGRGAGAQGKVPTQTWGRNSDGNVSVLWSLGFAQRGCSGFAQEDQLFSLTLAAQVALVVKNPPAKARHTRDKDSIPRWGRSPWVGNDTPLQCSCWKIPWATVHGPAKSQMQLSNIAHAWLYAKGKFFKIKCEAILKSLTFSASYWGHLWFGWPLWLRHDFLERESISRPISLRCPSSLRKKHENLAGYWQG